MKQRRTHADLRRFAARMPISVKIAAHRHWQCPHFLMDQLGQFPALHSGIGLDPRHHGVAVDLGPVAVISVLDENPVFGEGQRIDESIAVDLINCRVHHDRVGQPVGRCRAIFLSDEFLPAKIEMVEIGDAASVENAACCDLALVRQIDAGLRNFDGFALHGYRVGQHATQMAIIILRTDRVKRRIKLPPVRGKARFITIPLMIDKRLDNPPVLGGNVAGEERPDMIAAKRRRWIDQADGQVRTLHRQRIGRQSARKPPADNGDVAIDVRAHGLLL